MLLSSAERAAERQKIADCAICRGLQEALTLLELIDAKGDGTGQAYHDFHHGCMAVWREHEQRHHPRMVAYRQALAERTWHKVRP